MYFLIKLIKFILNLYAFSTIISFHAFSFLISLENYLYFFARMKKDSEMFVLNNESKDCM